MLQVSPVIKLVSLEEGNWSRCIMVS